MDELKKIIKKTGTATVGIVCKDGIVLAADKRAVAGDSYFIAHKRENKIYKIIENIVITTAGTVSDIQLIIKLTKAELKLKEVRTRMLPSVREAANLFASIVYENIRKFSPIVGISHFLLGGKDSEGFSLYEIYPDGSVTQHNNYLTSGAYGSIMGYGILENEWHEGMNIEEGKELALKIIRTAIKRDASVGEGINYVIIDKKGVSEIKEEPIEKKK